MTATPNEAAPATPTLLGLADVFARYGNFTLGGGNTTTAVLREELLERRRWMRLDQFTLCFSLARLTPGTNLLALQTGVGWMLRGGAGALTALLAGSIPSTLMIVTATALFASWQNNSWVQAAMSGAVAAGVALALRAAWTIARPFVRQGARLRVALLAGAAFALNALLKLSALEVLLLAAGVGFFLPATTAE